MMIMMTTTTFCIKTAGAFVFRSGRSTAALGAVICVAVGALIFLASVATGVNDCMIQNSTGLYAGQISVTGLPRAVAPADLAVPGVSQVLYRILFSGTINRADDAAGVSNADISNTAGALTGGLSITLVALDPMPEKETCFLWKKMITGTWLTPDEDGILISRSTAMTLNARPGTSLVLHFSGSQKQLHVTGIFDTGIPAMDQGLAFLPRSVLPVPSGIWTAAVFLRPGVPEERIISTLAEKGIALSQITTWQEAMPDLTQLIELNRISMGFVMVLVLGVVAFATASAFAIAIISRIREYGIMKTMGITPGETCLIIFSQVLLLNLLAAAGGMILGALTVTLTANTGIDLSGFTSHNQYFVVSGVIIPRLTPFSVLLPPGLALAFCLAAAAWPVLIVVRQRPASILRSL